MKKTQSKDAPRPRKLVLHAETLYTLGEREMQRVVGGHSGTCYSCNTADGLACGHL